MRGRPATEWEDISPNFTFSSFRGLNLVTDILLEAKLFALMVLVSVVVVVVVREGAEEGLTFPRPALTLTFCLLLGGDVSSIWLGTIMSVGCIFPISCKSLLSFTHFLPSQLTSVSGPTSGLVPRKFSLNSAKLGLCLMEAAKLLSVRREEETGPD